MILVLALINIINISSSRAPRRNYLQLNDGSDEEGDSDKPQPRSRRRIDPTPEITLNESVSQVNESVSQANELVLNESVSEALSIASQPSSLHRAYKPKPKESWLWESFYVIDLEKQYFYKKTKAMRLDKLITCSLCSSWSTTEAILQGSLSNLGAYLKNTY